MNRKTNGLPPLISKLSGLIGPGLAGRVMNEFGGLRIYIPLVAKNNHRLIEMLGQDNAARLSQEFGGETLAIPKGVAVGRMKRNLKIVKKRVSGSKIRALAFENKLTERQILSILGAARHVNEI